MTMLQAKPIETDYSAVLEFFQAIESWVEYGEAPEGEDADAFDLGDWIDSRWPHIDCCWRRVFFGGKVAIQAACDPDKDYIAFKPEINIALKAQKIMRKTEMHAIPVGPVGKSQWRAKTAEGLDMPLEYALADPAQGKRDCPHKAIVDAFEWLKSSKERDLTQPPTPEQVAKT